MGSNPFPASKAQPSWSQWAEFLVKYFLLPYQLIAEFAWDWLSVHYWTSRFLIVNAMLLSVLEGCSLYRVWTRALIRYTHTHTHTHRNTEAPSV